MNPFDRYANVVASGWCVQATIWLFMVHFKGTLEQQQCQWNVIRDYPFPFSHSLQVQWCVITSVLKSIKSHSFLLLANILTQFRVVSTIQKERERVGQFDRPLFEQAVLCDQLKDSCSRSGQSWPGLVLQNGFRSVFASSNSTSHHALVNIGIHRACSFFHE